MIKKSAECDSSAETVSEETEREKKNRAPTCNIAKQKQHRPTWRACALPTHGQEKQP